MKVLIKNVNFTMANARYYFKKIENYSIVDGYLLRYDSGIEFENGEYQLIRFGVSSNDKILRVSGSFRNTSMLAFKSSDGSTIDIVTPGVVEEYSVSNRLVVIPNGTSYIDVCRYKQYEKPIIEITSDKRIENDVFKIGNNVIFTSLLTYNTGVFQNPFSGYNTVRACVEGFSKIRVNGSFRNCCALVYFKDRELTQIVSIAQNNNGVLGDYTLNDSVNEVPEGAKYVASSYVSTGTIPTLEGII
jgi:hypothetical protein